MAVVVCTITISTLAISPQSVREAATYSILTVAIIRPSVEVGNRQLTIMPIPYTSRTSPTLEANFRTEADPLVVMQTDHSITQATEMVT